MADVKVFLKLKILGYTNNLEKTVLPSRTHATQKRISICVVYCFTTSISHGVENYFPRLWGTGISDAIFYI